MEGIIRKAKRTLTEEEVEGKIGLTGLTLQSSILLSSLPPFLSSFTTSFGAIGEAVFKVLHVVDNHAQMCLLTLLQNTYHSCRPVFTLQTFHAPTTKGAIMVAIFTPRLCVKRCLFASTSNTRKEPTMRRAYLLCNKMPSMMINNYNVEN